MIYVYSCPDRFVIGPNELPVPEWMFRHVASKVADRANRTCGMLGEVGAIETVVLLNEIEISKGVMHVMHGGKWEDINPGVRYDVGQRIKAGDKRVLEATL